MHGPAVQRNWTVSIKSSAATAVTALPLHGRRGSGKPAKEVLTIEIKEANQQTPSSARFNFNPGADSLWYNDKILYDATRPIKSIKRFFFNE